jgi:hypothetical protein
VKVKLGDRTYTVIFRAPPGSPPAWGMVVDHQKGKRGEIYLRRKMNRTELFRTMIHEALHAEFPMLDEAAIEVADKKIATFMLRVLRAVEDEGK